MENEWFRYRIDRHCRCRTRPPRPVGMVPRAEDSLEMDLRHPP